MSSTRKQLGGQCPCSAGKRFGGGGPLRRNGNSVGGNSVGGKCRKTLRKSTKNQRSKRGKRA